MSQCPNCGATVEDHAQSCHNCGVQLDQRHGQGQGGQGRTQQGGQPRPQQGGQQQGGQQQGGQRQPQQGGQRQPQQGRQQQPQQGGQGGYQQGGQGQHQQGGGQGPPPQGGYQQGGGYGGDDGMDRRQLLIGGGAVAAAAAGGWFFFLRESTPGGPEGVVHDWVDAFESGDAAAMDELVHQNSPARSGMSDPISQVEQNANSNLSASVESTEVVSREEDPTQPNVEEFATVKATISASQGGQSSETSTLRFVVAKNSNGEWTFWEQTFAEQEETGQEGTGQSTTEVMPSVNFVFDYAPDMGQNGDGAVTITHDAGDSVPARQLFIRGENVAPVGGNPSGNFVDSNWATLKGVSGSEEVAAGDGLELDAMADYEVRVVWESSTSDSTATLSRGEGPDA